ncbi:hypothetical protein CKM354_000481600 [Cercospora kikuchii]|uniref:Uncharacterized protein n=1 Tax=Cercospora kikuchii TaxID=84275 RepID=A0A9P3CEV9_9PEZI|nr:uncharacterized protein CKM354_000481600 [Cercospora kikuchii]GIZ41513.1 hypothetical protein CKM354_000481600 [Cercospora kikuchii]
MPKYAGIFQHAHPIRLPRRYTALLAILMLYLVFCHLAPAVQHTYQPLNSIQLPVRLQPGPKVENPNITTNLVIASTKAEDISWTNALIPQIPNLKIFRYVSDDPTAEYHPPAAQGREALMYFTYLFDKYEDLADVNIFIHAEEHPWHLDSALWQSMTFALSHLDLNQVLEKRYFNLYTSLKGGRPEGYNTSKTPLQTNNSEEPYMADALRANFGSDAVVPEILLGPCCSQFAVSRDAILSRPREQYEYSMKWLTDTDWPDQLTGRIWEHMWPFLFLRDQATDQKTEWRALCRMYGVCFKNASDHQQYQDVWAELAQLREEIGFGREILRPWSVRRTRRRLRELTYHLKESILEALERGLDEKQRYEAGIDINAS